MEDGCKSLAWVWGLGPPGASGVKNDEQWSITTKLGQKNHCCKLGIMVTFTEVKGHQRSNVINYVLCLPNLVRRNPDASTPIECAVSYL